MNSWINASLINNDIFLEEFDKSVLKYQRMQDHFIIWYLSKKIANQTSELLKLQYKDGILL